MEDELTDATFVGEDYNINGHCLDDILASLSGSECPGIYQQIFKYTPKP